MTTDSKVVFGAIVASAILLVSAVFMLGKDKSPKRDELGNATMTIDKTSADLGDMKVSDQKSATFTITNMSENSVLRIWGVSTSCNCTFANVTIGATKTGEFNMPMHMGSALKNWIGEIAAGERATLEIIYRPSVMPVQGAVSRQVRFNTNDPDNPQVEVSITANVL